MPSEPVRLTLWSVGCLLFLYVLMILFQSKDRSWIDAGRMWLPFLVATVPAYLIILWRLSLRRDDAIGLGLAIACGALAVLLLVGFVVSMAQVKEMALLNFIVGLMYWHVTLLTAFVVFVPLQIKLITSSYGVLLESGVGHAVGVTGGGVFAVAVYLTMAIGLLRPLAKGTAEASRRTEYSETAATAHLFKLYKCLWREAGSGAVNGFPASDEVLRARGPDCWDPKHSPGGTGYGTHYDFRYLPGAPDASGVIRSFAIATKKRNRRGTWTDSFYLDHLGILRRSVKEWASAETNRIESFKRSVLPELVGLLDAYHDVHDRYPTRILHSSQADQAGPHDFVIPKGELLAKRTRPGPNGTTIIERLRSEFVYAPVSSDDGNGTKAYTLAFRTEAKDIRDLRSYFVNTDGRIHCTGEERNATAADPVAPENEWVPGLRERTRRRVAPQLASAQAEAH